MTKTEVIGRQELRVEPVVLTIAIPMYEAEEHIAGLLRDVSAQIEGGVQLLVLDDASSDASVAVVAECLARLQGVTWTLLRHQHNAGAGKARKTLMRFAEGNYVWFLDSDDRLPRGAVKTVLREIPRLTGTEILVGAVQRHSPRTDQVTHLPGSDGMVGHRDSLQSMMALLSGRMTSYLCNKVIPAAALLPERMSPLRRSEDVATLIALFGAGYGTYTISETIYIYKTREGSVSQTWLPGQAEFLEAVVHITEMARRACPSPALEPSVLRYKYRGGIIGAMNNAAQHRGASLRMLANEARSVRKYFDRHAVHLLLRSRLWKEALTILLIQHAAPAAGLAFFLKERVPTLLARRT